MLFKLKNKLTEFADIHRLRLSTAYIPMNSLRHMTYRFDNPRNGATKTFDVFEDELVSILDVEHNYMEITRFLLRMSNMIDLIKKPDWMVNLEKEHPKKVYITTARGNGKEFLTEQLRRNRYIEQRFEMDVPKFYNSPEWIKMALNSCFGTGVDKKEKEMKAKIEKVYFNEPYTIVIWSDKTKTMVKATDENYDPEKGLAMAICKKFLGTNASKGNYFDEFKKWLPEDHSKPVVKEIYLSAAELAEKTGQSVSTVRKDCARGLHPGAKKVDGKWMIPYEGMARRK